MEGRGGRGGWGPPGGVEGVVGAAQYEGEGRKEVNGDEGADTAAAAEIAGEHSRRGEVREERAGERAGRGGDGGDGESNRIEKLSSDRIRLRALSYLIMDLSLDLGIINQSCTSSSPPFKNHLDKKAKRNGISSPMPLRRWKW